MTGRASIPDRKLSVRRAEQPFELGRPFHTKAKRAFGLTFFTPGNYQKKELSAIYYLFSAKCDIILLNSSDGDLCLIIKHYFRRADS
jgi:hypothetical protein